MPADDLFSSTELLGEMALAKMTKLSTSRYRAGLEPSAVRSRPPPHYASKSAVSRRFAETTEIALAELLATDLSTMDAGGPHVSLRPRTRIHPTDNA